jgi:hypothetical protein
MLAVMWPFGSPARCADSGGAQTRYAQTMRAFSPVSAARLGHTTRPGKTAEMQQTEPKPVTPRSTSLDGTDVSHRRAGQLVALRQGPPIHENVRSRGRAAGVGQWEERRERGLEKHLKRYLA